MISKLFYVLTALIIVLAACAPAAAATETDGCGFGPIPAGTLLHKAKHVEGALYQLTGETKLAKEGEYCESGLPFNIDDENGDFLGAYGYGFVKGQVEDHPEVIWIVGHNSPTQEANLSESTNCEGTAMTVDGGNVTCDGEWGVFSFTETTAFDCTPVGDTLSCDTTKGAVFTVTAPEPATPTPYPTYTAEELAQLEQEASTDNSGPTSLTGYYDCGIYSVGVSTLEELGEGDATCGTDNVTFTINLPVAISELWCARDVYGWACGSEGQSFWFFLLP